MAGIHINWDFEYMKASFNSIELLHRQFVSHRNEIRAAEEKAMKETAPGPSPHFSHQGRFSGMNVTLGQS